MKVQITVKSDQVFVGKDLLSNVIDPEIASFAETFRKLSGTPLTGMEKEILRAYLYNKLLLAGNDNDDKRA